MTPDYGCATKMGLERLPAPTQMMDGPEAHTLLKIATHFCNPYLAVDHR